MSIIKGKQATLSISQTECLSMLDKFSYKPNLWKTQASSFLSRHDLQYIEDSKDTYPNLWITQASDHEISILLRMTIIILWVQRKD
jgi:hypothetical protein